MRRIESLLEALTACGKICGDSSDSYGQLITREAMEAITALQADKAVVIALYDKLGREFAALQTDIDVIRKALEKSVRMQCPVCQTTYTNWHANAALSMIKKVAPLELVCTGTLVHDEFTLCPVHDHHSHSASVKR